MNLSKFSNRKIASDVEEELRFHLEMLELKFAGDGLTDAEAKAAANTRFGNFDKFKKQCVEISRRTSPLRQLLKASTILLAFTGLLVHFLSSEYRVARIGHILIAIAVLSRLLLYVRGLNPSPSITRKPECS